jgi:hypothetical protein
MILSENSRHLIYILVYFDSFSDAQLAEQVAVKHTVDGSSLTSRAAEIHRGPIGSQKN